MILGSYDEQSIQIQISYRDQTPNKKKISLIHHVIHRHAIHVNKLKII